MRLEEVLVPGVEAAEGGQEGERGGGEVHDEVGDGCGEDEGRGGMVGWRIRS